MLDSIHELSKHPLRIARTGDTAPSTARTSIPARAKVLCAMMDFTTHSNHPIETSAPFFQFYFSLIVELLQALTDSPDEGLAL